MDERRENCPYAFRRSGDPNVLCKIVAKRQNVKWVYCKHQHDCRKTGRWEANEDSYKCEIRNKGV